MNVRTQKNDGYPFLWVDSKLAIQDVNQSDAPDTRHNGKKCYRQQATQFQNSLRFSKACKGLFCIFFILSAPIRIWE